MQPVKFWNNSQWGNLAWFITQNNNNSVIVPLLSLRLKQLLCILCTFEEAVAAGCVVTNLGEVSLRFFSFFFFTRGLGGVRPRARWYTLCNRNKICSNLTWADLTQSHFWSLSQFCTTSHMSGDAPLPKQPLWSCGCPRLCGTTNLVSVPSADRLSSRHTVRLCSLAVGQPAVCWLKAVSLSHSQPCECGWSYFWPLTDSYPWLVQNASHVCVPLLPSAVWSRECFLKGKRTLPVGAVWMRPFAPPLTFLFSSAKSLRQSRRGTSEVLREVGRRFTGVAMATALSHDSLLSKIF